MCGRYFFGCHLKCQVWDCPLAYSFATAPANPSTKSCLLCWAQKARRHLGSLSIVTEWVQDCPDTPLMYWKKKLLLFRSFRNCRNRDLSKFPLMPVSESQCLEHKAAVRSLAKGLGMENICLGRALEINSDEALKCPGQLSWQITPSLCLAYHINTCLRRAVCQGCGQGTDNVSQLLVPVCAQHFTITQFTLAWHAFSKYGWDPWYYKLESVIRNHLKFLTHWQPQLFLCKWASAHHHLELHLEL